MSELSSVVIGSPLIFLGFIIMCLQVAGGCVVFNVLISSL